MKLQKRKVIYPDNYLLENYRSIQSVVSDNSKQLNDLSTELDSLREEVDSEDYEESIEELNELGV